MNPLTHCPHCKAALVKKTIPEKYNPFKYENCSKRCVVDYFQYYQKSYDEVELNYVNFNSPDNKFGIYVYFQNHTHSNQVYVYSNDATHKHGSSMPILILPLDKYPFDFNNMDKSFEKIATLSMFV